MLFQRPGITLGRLQFRIVTTNNRGVIRIHPSVRNDVKLKVIREYGAVNVQIFYSALLIN